MESASHNDIIYNFMTAHPCVALATSGEEGSVNLAHVFVYVDTNFDLYFISRPDHRKAVNALEHPKVTLLFSDKETVEQVEYMGTAAAIDEVEDIAPYMAKLQEVISEHKTDYWIPPVSQIEGEGYIMFKIVPGRVLYRKYGSSASKDDLEEYKVDLSV